MSSASARVKNLAVVHLVRRANGEDPFLRFLRSYREHPAGVEHDLVLLLKGFDSDAESARYRAHAADVSSQWIGVSDSGYDITAYLAAARQLPHSRLSFVNSFSQILADGWLASLADALDMPGIGLAGATGSWGSHLSYMQFDLGFGGPYAAVYGDRHAAQSQMRERGTGLPQSKRTLRRMLKTSEEITRRIVGFPPFPAPHVRTNGFMLASETLRLVKAGRQRDKFDAYRMEGGRRSLTRQIQAFGLRAVVVGRDGRAYEEPEWAQSRTCCQRDQENLLIADNQTTAYENADLAGRTTMAQFHWGPAAEPSIPGGPAGRSSPAPAGDEARG